MSRAEILRHAEEMVCGHREQDYGTPEDNFGVIAELWSDYINASQRMGVVRLEPRDVAAMMALLKIARISTGKGTADCWVDLAGYAACGGEIDERLLFDVERSQGASR